MHEMSLCQSLIDIILEQQATAGFQRVLCVRLVIGALSHVAPEAIEFGFEVVARGTVVEGARLEIERPSGQAHCLACSVEVTITRRDDPCPRCGGFQLVVTGGDEMRLRELEVD